jgi:hypothetical protein
MGAMKGATAAAMGAIVLLSIAGPVSAGKALRVRFDQGTWTVHNKTTKTVRYHCAIRVSGDPFHQGGKLASHETDRYIRYVGQNRRNTSCHVGRKKPDIH